MKKSLVGLGCALTAALPVFAQEGEAAPARQGNMMQTLIMIGVAIVFFTLSYGALNKNVANRWKHCAPR